MRSPTIFKYKRGLVKLAMPTKTWKRRQQRRDRHELQLSTASASVMKINLTSFTNTDNTCYFNCIVHILLTTCLFRTVIQNYAQTSGTLTTDLAVLAEELQAANNNTSRNIDNLKSRALYLINSMQRQNCATSFNLGEQQDVLEIFHLTCQILRAENPGTIFEQILSVTAVQDVRCRACNNTITSNVPVFEVAVTPSTQPSDAQTLLINSMSEDVSFACQNLACASNNSTKSWYFSHPPSVLFVYVNRSCVRWSGNTMTTTKNRTTVNMNETLSCLGPRYSLSAVVSHVGQSLNAGHYVTYISHNHKYHLIDDGNQYSVDLPDVGDAVLGIYEVDGTNPKQILPPNNKRQLTANISRAISDSTREPSTQKRLRISASLTNAHTPPTICAAQKAPTTSAHTCNTTVPNVRGIPDNGSAMPPIDPTVANILKEIEAQLDDSRFQYCSVCNERVFNPQARWKMCGRCRKDKKTPKLYSNENCMIPGEAPPEFDDVTLAEEALLAIVLPQVCVFDLRQGSTVSKGHVLALPQDLQGFVSSLPRYPKDLPFICIRKTGTDNNIKEFRVNRDRILKCLRWLQQNNPFYQNIYIDWSALNILPSDGYISTHIRNIVDDRNLVADLTHLSDVTPDDVASDSSGFTTRCNVESTDNRIRQQVDQISKGDSDSSNHATYLPYPQRSNVPVNEFTCVGLLAKAFWTLFPYGTGDFSTPRNRKEESLQKYFQHLIWYYNSRLEVYPFVKHRIFVHYACNLLQRWAALTTGRVYVSRCNRNLTLDELKDKLEQNDTSVLQGLTYFGKRLLGTEQYCYQKRQEAHSVVVFNTIENNQGMELFISLTDADLHHPSLHKMLPRHGQAYLGKTVVDEKSLPQTNSISTTEDYLLRKNAIADNPHITTWRFKKKVELVKEKLLKPVYGLQADITRYERQKGRGTIHAHICASFKGLPTVEEYDIAFQREPTVRPFSEVDDKLFEKIQNTRILVLQKIASVFPDLRASHPSDDPVLWPQPEGTCAQPLENALRREFRDVPAEDRMRDYIDLLNRVLLHKHSVGYCVDSTSTDSACRFGYDKDLREEAGFKTGGNAEILLPRNHPRVVPHLVSLLLVWRANLDVSLVSTLDNLIAYVIKYALKNDKLSESLKQIITKLCDEAVNSSSSSTERVCQKLLMRTISRSEYTKQQACEVLQGNHEVTFSHQIRHISFAGNIDLEQFKKNTRQRTMAELYQDRDSDKNFHALIAAFKAGNVVLPCEPKDISLYQFVSKFNTKWQLVPKPFVPHPVPTFIEIPNRKSNKYNEWVQQTLLLHKPSCTINKPVAE